MRLNKFDLNLLLALDALLREKSVTRAAARLFVSQPAMSAALSKLREHFDNPLLVRVGRQMELTARARELREPVRQMLLDAQTFLGAERTFDPAVERRTFTVLCPDYVSPWLMPGILRRLQNSAPGIRIEIERPAGADLASLLQGDVDLVLSLDPPDALSYPALPESIDSTFVADLRYVCILSADHPNSSDGLTVEQFLNQQFIIVRQARRSSRVEEIIQERFSVQLDVRAVTENVLELPFLVTTGTTYVAVTLESLGKFLKSSPRLRVLDLPGDLMPPSQLDMLWHRSQAADPAHVWLRNLIIEECAAQGGTQPAASVERAAT
jgi:DNA-binding transcriptional LysR family regulator